MTSTTFSSGYLCWDIILVVFCDCELRYGYGSFASIMGFSYLSQVFGPKNSTNLYLSAREANRPLKGRLIKKFRRPLVSSINDVRVTDYNLLLRRWDRRWAVPCSILLMSCSVTYMGIPLVICSFSLQIFLLSVFLNYFWYSDNPNGKNIVTNLVTNVA